MATLTGTFKSQGGTTYTVKIYNEQIDSNGTLLLDADPVHLIVSNQDLKYIGLRSTECQINVLSKTDLAELYTEDILGTSVVVKKGDDTVFAGFLEPSQWNQPCIKGRYNTMQLVAIDAWSALLQYPMITRKSQKMIEWLIEMLNLIDTPFSSMGESIGYLRKTDFGNRQLVISNDSLMPSDLYAEDGIDSFPTYGQILQELGMATNNTFMMIADNLEVFNVDAINTFWTKNAESELLSDSVSLEIVPTYRRVVFETDTPPQQEQPELTSNGDAYVQPYYVNGTANKYKDKYAYFYHARNGYYKNWQNNGTIPAPSSSVGVAVQCMMGVNYAGSRSELKRDKDAFFLGCSAISNPIHYRLCTAVSNNKGLFDFKVEADIFINPDYSSTDPWAIVPQLWKTGRTEAVVNGSPNSTSTIALMIDDFVVNPSYVTTDFDSNDSGWQHCTFQFRAVDTGQYLNNGKVQIILRSPVLNSTNGYRFARNVKFVYNDAIFVDSINDPVNNKSTGSDLKLDFTLNTIANSSGEANKGTIMGGIVGVGSTDDLITAIKSQYCAPRRKWNITLSSDGYDPRHKVKYDGKTCTQMGSDWDLRKDTIKVSILESN